jgi:hypothetical protein
MARYDVALWRAWPTLFPDVGVVVEARNAFAAIEGLMLFCGYGCVAYASARATDGSLVYRGYRVCRNTGGVSSIGSDSDVRSISWHGVVDTSFLPK